MNSWITLAIISLILAGLSGITQKLCTDNVSFEMSFVYFSIAMGVLSVGALFATPFQWSTLTSGQILLIASGGLLNGLGVFTSFAALERGGSASVVIPIINLYPLVTVLGAWLFFSDRMSGRQMFGLVLAVAAVLLLSQESPKQLIEKKVESA